MARPTLLTAAAVVATLVSTAILHAAQTGASITGRVIDENGKPVPQFVIRYFRADQRESARTVVTNSEGEYRIDGLQDGTYFVGFFDPDWIPPAQRAGLEPLPDAASELASVATPLTRRVVVANGVSVSGIDFVVIPQTGLPRVEVPASGGAPDLSPRPGNGQWWRSPGFLGSVAAVGVGAAVLLFLVLARRREPTQ